MKNIYLGKGMIVAIILFINAASFAQGKWFFDASLQMSGGSYFFSSHMNAYYLYGGLRYQEGDFGISFNLPLIATNGGSVSQFGGTYLPTQNEMHGSYNNSSGSDQHTGMMGGGMFSNINFSIGDLYVNANYNLLTMSKISLVLYTNGYVKVPIADQSLGLGTGKFDYNLNVGLRNNYRSFLFYGEVGYILLGDSEEIKYLDPVIYKFGIGKYFNEYNFGLLVDYYAYTEIIDGYNPPAQVSFGLQLNTSGSMSYNFVIAKGLSELNPDYILSGGMNLLL